VQKIPVGGDILAEGIELMIPQERARLVVLTPMPSSVAVRCVVTAQMPPSENPMSKSFETGQSHAYAKDSCN
jgi:hypothetical protein